MDYIEFILLVFIVLAGYTLGWLLTETRYRLSRWPLFQFEAFESGIKIDTKKRTRRI